MSKVAKKFHLDPDGYLTTKPDRELTTEEEATDAAEAAIGEALEEGGAITEAIADSKEEYIVHFTHEYIDNEIVYHADKKLTDILEHLESGQYDVYMIWDPSGTGFSYQKFTVGKWVKPASPNLYAESVNFISMCNDTQNANGRWDICRINIHHKIVQGQPDLDNDEYEVYTEESDGSLSTGMVVNAIKQVTQTEKQIDKTYEQVYNYVANGGYDAILVDKAAGGMVAHFLVCYGDASSGQIQFVATDFNGSRLDMTRYLMEPSKPGVVTYTQGQFMPAS